MRAQGLEGETAHVMAIDQYPSVPRVEETWQQAGQRALPGTGGSHQRNEFSRLSAQRNVLEHSAAGFIAKGYILETDQTSTNVQGDGSRVVRDSGFGVQHFPNTLRTTGGSLNRRAGVSDGFKRAVKRP